jgi:hypothetical protein
LEKKPDLILNVGTVVSLGHELPFEVFGIPSVIERDMIAEALATRYGSILEILQCSKFIKDR